MEFQVLALLLVVWFGLVTVDGIYLLRQEQDAISKSDIDLLITLEFVGVFIWSIGLIFGIVPVWYIFLGIIPIGLITYSLRVYVFSELRQLLSHLLRLLRPSKEERFVRRCVKNWAPSLPKGYRLKSTYVTIGKGGKYGSVLIFLREPGADEPSISWGELILGLRQQLEGSLRIAIEIRGAKGMLYHTYERRNR